MCIIVDWVKDGLRVSQKEQEEFHRKAIKKFHAQYEKLQHRISQIYLDKLDGEIEEAFDRKNVSQWRKE